MAGVNKAILVGNIGTDLELRHTKNGKAVVNLRLAVSDHRDDTEWFSCVAFDKKAETLAQYGRKGGQLYVEGRIVTNEWETKEGERRADKEIIIANYQLLGSKPKDEQQQGEPRSYNQYREDDREQGGRYY